MLKSWSKFVKIKWKINQYNNTFPSYSRRERTSGAMYAGVPTVDFGLECKRDDYHSQTNKEESYGE